MDRWHSAGTGLLFQVPFWVLVPGFQKEKYVCCAGEPRPLGFTAFGSELVRVSTDREEQ